MLEWINVCRTLKQPVPFYRPRAYTIFQGQLQRQVLYFVERQLLYFVVPICSPQNGLVSVVRSVFTTSPSLL